MRAGLRYHWQHRSNLFQGRVRSPESMQKNTIFGKRFDPYPVRYFTHVPPGYTGVKTQLESVLMSDTHKSDEAGSLLLQEARPKLKKPPLYKVILLNDDYTPMEFVVEVLESFFHMDRAKATQVMLHVHTRGVGVCGVFTRDIAETKVAGVTDFARVNQHPLLCTMEEA